MTETNDINDINDINEPDNNDDMIANPNDIDNSISFKVNESATPDRGWTKKQMRNVWITGIVITILLAVCSFFLNDVNIFGIFA